MSHPRPIQTPSSQGGQAFLWLLAILAAVVVTALFVWNSREAEAAADPSSIYTVGRERLRISVVESGQLKAAASQDIASAVRGQATILELVEEGTFVREGDVLVRLDASTLEDDHTQQKIRFETARADHVQAVEALEIQKSTNASNISQAELRLALARQDLAKYEQGDYPMRKEEAEENIRLSKMNLADALQKYQDTEELFDLDFAAKTELDRDRLNYERRKISLNNTENKKIILEDFQHKRDLQVYQWDVQEFANELERVKRRANADLAQKEAANNSRKATLDLEESKLRQFEEQIAAAVVRAPRDGLVVYPSNADTRHRGNDNNRIELGSTVRERQLLITLPDTSHMLAQIKVHESVIDKVKVGQAAMVTLDANPEVAHVGKVSFVAPLPDSSSSFLNPDLKEYRVEVTLGGDTQDLRPGMSISAEILVDEIADALTVPIHSVRNQAGNLFVYQRRDGAPVIQPVDIGMSNSSRVVIQSGLEEGDQIYLAVPAGAPAPDFEEVEEEAPVPEAESAAPAAPAGPPSPRGNPGGMGSMDEATRERMRNATPEERKKMIEEMMQNRSPEDRAGSEQMRRRFGGDGADQDGGDGGH